MLNRIRKVPMWLRDTFIGKWRVALGERLPEDELTEQLLEASLPSFGFFFLLTMSALIATLGLIANSTATIIGAMIIAPLKGPIDTLSYGLVKSDVRLIRRALWTLATGIVTVILLAFLLAVTVGSRYAHGEILARGNPNLLDLGVALAAGAAGAFSLTRRNITGAPAGVAIAVALVPPLCVVGIGLGLEEEMSAAHVARVGETNLAFGAGLLFLTNLFAIAFSGALIFLVQSYGTVKRAAPMMALALACVGAVAYPLHFSLWEMLVQNRTNAEIHQVAAQYFPDWAGRVYDLTTSVAVEDDTVFASIYVTAPDNLIKREHVKLLQQTVANRLSLPVDIEFQILPYTSIAFDADRSP